MPREYETLKYVDQCIEQEGFWYCFDSYSDFKEVDDEMFHHLRMMFLAAGAALKNYVEKNK